MSKHENCCCHEEEHNHHCHCDETCDCGCREDNPCPCGCDCDCECGCGCHCGNSDKEIAFELCRTMIEDRTYTAEGVAEAFKKIYEAVKSCK